MLKVKRGERSNHRKGAGGVVEASVVRRKELAAMVAVAFTLAAALAIGALWGCSPTQAGGSESEPMSGTAKGGEEISTVESVNFLDNSSGLYPDTYTNSEMLNIGNRGCNACHDDLFDVMTNHPGNTHILFSVGYDKKLTYKDCEPCHRAHGSTTGPYFGDLIHASHYSSQNFVDNNGNCWSCHALNSAGNPGDYQFMLWDDFKNSEAVGGFVAGTNSSVRWWVESRTGSDYMTGVATEESPQIEAEFNQDVTDPSDVFIVNNWGEEITEKGGEPYSFADVVDQNAELSISGVKNPRTFTLEEVRAMDQVDFTAQHSCGTNGLGGSLVANIPCTGVKFSDLIEMCGGLADGVNAITVKGEDGWSSIELPIDAYMENGYLVTKYYGENLTADQGAPWVLACKGYPGVQWVKHVSSVDIHANENVTNFYKNKYAKTSDLIFPVNAMWFDNDGKTFKLGEPVELSGAVWSWTGVVDELDTISISTDMGVTWTEFDVQGELSDFDPDQWVRFTMSWTPSEAGTYNVKLKGTDVSGNSMSEPVSCVIRVEE